MDTREMCECTVRLEVLRRRFERYRRNRKVRSPIPEGLWAAATKAAGTFGINSTARALRLNYHDLKKRVERNASDALAASQPNASQFIELCAPASRCDCTVELEDAGGDKMRIHLQSMETPDLASLSRSFWVSNS